MAKSSKMGPQKVRLLGRPDVRKDVKNEKARETYAFNKEKETKLENEKSQAVRVARRPEPKKK